MSSACGLAACLTNPSTVLWHKNNAIWDVVTHACACGLPFSLCDVLYESLVWSLNRCTDCIAMCSCSCHKCLAAALPVALTNSALWSSSTSELALLYITQQFGCPVYCCRWSLLWVRINLGTDVPHHNLSLKCNMKKQCCKCCCSHQRSLVTAQTILSSCSEPTAGWLLWVAV